MTIEKKWKCTIEKLPNGWRRPHWEYTTKCVDEDVIKARHETNRGERLWQ